MSKRTALVTGANRGLGLEICRQLAARGVDVVLTARDADLGAEAAKRLGVRFEELDVSRDDSVDACARRLGRQRVDILVNNAGIYPPGGTFEADFREAVETNLLGALRTCRAFVPGMIRAGWGRVVNLSSGYGQFSKGLAGPAAYSVTKAALNALTAKMASELPPFVKVNSCCPGWVRTRMGGPGADLSVEEGADTPVWLALLPDDGPTGGFFRGRNRQDW